MVDSDEALGIEEGHQVGIVGMLDNSQVAVRLGSKGVKNTCFGFLSCHLSRVISFVEIRRWRACCIVLRIGSKPKTHLQGTYMVGKMINILEAV